MKKHLLLFALALCCATASSAQIPNTTVKTDCKPLTIKFLGFSDHNGNRVRGADLRDMLECVQDKTTTNRFKSGHAIDWIGAGLVAAGSVLVLAAGATKSPYGPSDEQLKLGLWGLETMGVGLGIQLGGLLAKKSAVRRYNELALGVMPANVFAGPSATAEKTKEKRIGVSFGKTFYKRGIEAPAIVYIEGIPFDDNSEIVNSGFYLSIFSENKLSDRFRGRAEFNWVQRGFGLSMRGSSPYLEANSKTRALTNYLEAAWLAQFVANPSKPGILLSAGPGLGFLTGVKIKSRATVRDIQTGESNTASESTKVDLEGYSFSDRLDYGLHLGTGARWPAGDGQVCFDVRYYLGLKNVNDDPYSPEKEFNRGWSLGLGYAMPF
ncbi:MAG: PorT family protein [Thermoanaerobaculia bacterium]|nr:PorT family protein [Thermoanaerobaculia bacterium]